MSTTDRVKEEVKQKYGSAARSVSDSGNFQACCDPGLRCCDPITTNLYSADEKGLIPEKAILASLGCGNPTALIELKAGEVVLDLGSGGGIDVLLSARRVGETGKAYGLDMTDEMLALARENQRQAGVSNVEFLKGEIEHIPLPHGSVDVIISNCVINLSADKRQVLREAFRVLKPGGRFAVSDVVVRGDMPAAVRSSMELWVGCVAGALEEAEYQRLLAEAWLNWKGRGRFHAESDGSRPADRVNPQAIETLRDYDIPWAGHAPRSIDGLEREPWDFVITVCDRAKEACPIFPGQPILAHWGMPDPAEVVGDEAAKRKAFEAAFLSLSRRIDLLLAQPVEELERLTLEARLRAIGNTTGEGTG